MRGTQKKSGGIPWKGILAAICLVVGMIVIGLTADSNDAGYRTVVQYPNGTLRVKFDAGWYFKLFGNTTVYPDVVTYDFDRSSNDEGATIDQTGIQVRYRDGGSGTVFGIAQFMLPMTKDEMIKLHKIYRTPNGVAHKVVKQSVDEAANLTAGLMASEDAYDNLRARYTEWMNDQVKGGKFKTRTKEIIVKDEVTGKTVTKSVPVIAYGEDGNPIHLVSDLQSLGITLVGSVKLDKADFETRTLEQISKKREATMAIITAKANAEKAKQDAITAEETGKANVMTAQYEEEVVKKRAIVVADREREVAVIAASRKVDVAEQRRLEAEQMKLVAEQIKQEQILLGEGEAERKRLVMEADGQLALKLDAWKEVQIAAYRYLGQEKLVPDTMIINGGGSDGQQMANAGNNVQTFMDLLTVKALKDMNMDMDMVGKKSNKVMASN
jgi:hypothetical protein